MSYRVFLLATVYAIALTGWGAVWVSDRVAAPWLLATLAALLAGPFLDARGRHPLRPAWNRALLVLGLAVAVLDWRWGSGSWFLAVVVLLLYVTIVRTLAPKANRDLMQMVALAFLQLLAASVLTLNLGYALFFLAFFVLLPWSLFAVAVKAELEGEYDILRGRVAVAGQRVDVPAGAERMLSRGILATMLVALALTATITVFLFALFPRLNTGKFSGRLGLERPVSGLSEEVRLGSVGTILQSSRPAARLIVLSGNAPPADDVYLRALALTDFDGTTWRETGRTINAMAFRGEIEFARRNNAPTQRFRVLMEDMGTQLLLTVPRLVSLDVPRDRIRAVELPGAIGSLRAAGQQGGMRYEFESATAGYLPRVDWSQLAAHPELPTELQRLTAIPAALSLPREIDDAAASTSLADVGSWAARFQSWDYTLDTPQGDDTLAAFFARRAGHCELFATSMALMLRRAGVPAVVVTGFRGGEWLAGDDYLLVRERNAHSWVEAWHPALGWFAIDPTPAALPVLSRWQQAAESWQRGVDRIRLFWMDYVVAYDLSVQVDAVSKARDLGAGAREDARRWRGWWRDTLGGAARLVAALVAAAVATVGFVVVRRLLRRRGGDRRRAASYRPPPRWVRALVKDLEVRYGRRELGVPLRTWLRRLAGAEDVAPRAALAAFAADYDAWRFGNRGTAPELRRRAEEIRAYLRLRDARTDRR